MENVQERSLVMFLAQHKEHRLDKLKDSQRKEEPVADVHLQPHQIR